MPCHHHTNAQEYSKPISIFSCVRVVEFSNKLKFVKPFLLSNVYILQCFVGKKKKKKKEGTFFIFSNNGLNQEFHTYIY